MSDAACPAARGTRPRTGGAGLPRTIFPDRSTMQPYAFTTTKARIFVGPFSRSAPPWPASSAPSPVARGRRSPGAARSEREPPRAHRADGGATELLVRVDRVLPNAVVEEDRARYEGDVDPLRRVPANLEHLGRDAGRGFQAV